MRIEFTYVRADKALGAATDQPDTGEDWSLPATVTDAGFDRILLTGADTADRFLARSDAELCIAQTVGRASPVVDARRFAALDRASNGRLALRIVAPDRPDADLDAEAPGHVAVLRRLDEYLTLLKRLFANTRPFDHEGKYFRLEGAMVADKGPRGGAIPLRLSGRSGTAVDVAGRHADVFELPAADIDELRALIGRVRVAASSVGRGNRIRFALPVSIGGDEAGAVALPADPARAAAAVLRHADLGIDEFMVVGLTSEAAIANFGSRYASVLRNSFARVRAESAAASAPARGAFGTAEATGHAWWAGFGRWPS